MKLPRGLRNKNPGNIRHSKTKWQGMVDVQLDDSFVTFSEDRWGIRALYRVLRTYQSVYRIKTIAGMINRWAPPVENDTTAYIASVALACGVKPDEPFDILFGTSNAVKLIAAIIHHENGQQPYSEFEIRAAVEME